jgi:hypothetical protein
LATEQKDFRVKNGLLVGGEGNFAGPVVVGTPSSNSHAATKQYVDEAITGGSSADGGTVVTPGFTMQQRRGTALEWSLTDPVLEEGEIGVETDTGLFKIGNGVDLFTELPYFITADGLDGSLEDYILLSTKGEALGVAELDSDGNVPASQLGNAEPVGAVSEHNLEILNVHGIPNTSLLATTSDLSSKQDKVSGVSDEEIGYLANVTSDIQAQINDKQSKVIDVSDTEIGYLSNVTSDIQGQIDGKASLSGATFTNFVTLHADPTQALHAATKEYVDNVSSGILSKPSVLAATTENLDATYDNGTSGVGSTLTSNTNGAFPLIDGVQLSLLNGQKGLLVKNQTNPAHNGRYNLTTLGDETAPWVLTKCGLCATAAQVPGSYIFVLDGTLNGGTGWVLFVEDPATFVVGSDPVYAFQFSGAGTIAAGYGIDVVGNQISVDTTEIAEKNHTHLWQDITDVSSVSLTELGYLDGVTSSIQTQLNDKSPKLLSLNEQATAYTLALSDIGKVVEINSSTDLDLTIPNESAVNFPIGTSIDIVQFGSGAVTIAESAGVTLLSKNSANMLTIQYSAATIYKKDTNTWVAIGDLS